MTPDSLLAWRNRLGLNQTGAALSLGTSRNYYMAMEAGRSKIPRYIALACAAIALGVPPHP